MKLTLFTLTLLFFFDSYSQIDSAFINRIKALDTANVLRSDTLSVPNNALTKKIKLLLDEKRGLTIGTILRLKLTEEQQKDTTHTKDFYSKLLAECTTGKTGKLIENSLINLYSRTFRD